MPVTVEELAALIQGQVIGDGSVPIRAARPVTEAGPDDITFIQDEKYARLLRRSAAGAAIVGPHFRLRGQRPDHGNDHDPALSSRDPKSERADALQDNARQASEAPGDGAAPVPTDTPANADTNTDADDAHLPRAVIQVADPLQGFLRVVNHLRAAEGPGFSGIHPLSYIAPGAKLGANVTVFPHAYIGEHTVIGDNCVLHPGAIVGDRCRLGDSVTLHPHVVLYTDVTIGDRVVIHAGSVIGSDGFGYRMIDGLHVKVPQIGRVEIGDDVEIGSNCAIDRATFETTRIGAGTKIDNLVMIGHNNLIGKHNLLCGQVGLAGSCTTGDYVVVAGQAGIKDHTTIGDRVVIGGQAGVTRNIDAGSQVLGSPAMPVKQQRQIFAVMAKLPDILHQIRDMARQLAHLHAHVYGHDHGRHKADAETSNPEKSLHEETSA